MSQPGVEALALDLLELLVRVEIAAAHHIALMKKHGARNERRRS